MSVVYLYALLREPPQSAGRGMAREPLRAMRCGKLVAMVGTMKARPDVDAKRLKAHDTVVRRLAARAPAILPARFGGLLEESELRDLLRSREKSLVAALALVKDREQMILRLSGDVLAALAVPAARRAAPASGATSGATYLRARRAALAAAQSAPELEPLRRALSARLRGERIRRHERPPLIATAYHLIDRGSAAVYRAAARRAARAAGLRIRITGPFPPYAFAPEGIA